LTLIIGWLIIFVSVFIVSIAGSALVFSTGLIVHEAVSRSLTLVAMGLLAGLTSSWMSNFLRVGGTRSRLLNVVAVAEGIAGVLLIINSILAISPAGQEIYRLPGRNIFILAIWGGIVSLGSCLAVWRLRGSVHSAKRDAVVSLVLLASIPLIVVVTIFVASLFGLTGA